MASQPEPGPAIARTLAIYRTVLRGRQLSPHTERSYLSRAAAYLHWQADQSSGAWTSATSVQAYGDSLAAAGHTDWTVNANLTAVQDLIHSVGGRPAAKVAYRPTPRMHSHILTATEQDALTAILPTLRPMDRLLILLLWDLASTPAEASALRDQDIHQVDPSAGSVQPLDPVVPRFSLTVSEFDILVPPRLSAAIAEHVDQVSTGFLIAAGPRQRAQQISELTITKIVNAVGQRSGIHDLSARVLRRTAIAAVITNPDADLSAFKLSSRVQPKHARRIRRSVLAQFSELERSLVPDRRIPATVPSDFMRAAAAELTSAWSQIMKLAHPELGNDIAAEQPQTLNDALNQALAPALLADTPTQTATGFHDHLNQLVPDRSKLVHIYRRHLAAQPLLGVPASLAVFLLTRPGREPFGSDHGVPGLVDSTLRQAVSDLVAIQVDPDLGSEAWQLRPAD